MIQEKIQKKAEGFGKLAPVFLEGAEFALENQWISVDDDLPCNHEELINIDTRSIHQKTLFVIVWNGKFIDIDLCFTKKVNGNGFVITQIHIGFRYLNHQKNRRLDYE